MIIDRSQLSLVSKGANFDLMYAGRQVGAIEFGLHLGRYGIVIKSGNAIFAYSLKAANPAELDPCKAFDPLLDAFAQKGIEHAILYAGDIGCYQHQSYLFLTVNAVAIMGLSLHPIHNCPDVTVFCAPDEHGNTLPYEYYIYPICQHLSTPGLKLAALVHSMGWCANRF